MRRMQESAKSRDFIWESKTANVLANGVCNVRVPAGGTSVNEITGLQLQTRKFGSIKNRPPQSYASSLGSRPK